MGNSSVSSPQEFMTRMKETLSFHPVQTIGTENIVAAKLVSTAHADSLVCLLHGKCKQGGLDVIIRSQNSDLSAQLNGLAQKNLM